MSEPANFIQEYIHREIPVINQVLERQIRDLNPLVREVAEHVLMAGGKRLRPLLTILCSRCFGLDSREEYDLGCAFELVHSATLIHDDILDNADLRRGRKAAHLIFGLDRTVLAGDALLALSNMIVAAYGDARLTQCVSEALLHTASGETEEIFWMRKPNLDRENYLQIIRGKTAYLIQAACKCGCMLAGAEKERIKECSEYGFNIGIAFQLVDDALDYTSDSSTSGKPLGGDLAEGKLTLPFILYLNSLKQEEKSVLLAKLAADSFTREEREDLILQVQKCGFADQVREEAGAYIQRGREALLNFPESKEKKILEMITDVILYRNH
ncbi:MAG: polyprenyl synthetase family protein [Desulfonatronovibrionaceae bacterium]